MLKPKPWFDRQFIFPQSNDHFPNVLERLRGTSARLDECLSRIPHERQKQSLAESSWTIKEQTGHLLQLEPLWAGRVDDICNEVRILRDTDLENRSTFEAKFNTWNSGAILAAFRRAREEWTNKLAKLDPAELEKTSLHPRLESPMRIIDLAFFVAEHDDHHLATISWIYTQLLEVNL